PPADVRRLQVAAREVRLAEAGEDVPRDDRHVVAVEVELLVARGGAELEDDGVALRRDALQPGIPPQWILRVGRDLEGVEREDEVLRRQRLSVTPLDALADPHHA